MGAESSYEETAVVQVRYDRVHRAVAVQEMLNVVAAVDDCIPLPPMCLHVLTGWKVKDDIS